MLYKTGMYGGSFNPLHLGHVHDIIEASTMCEKLYVILSYSNNRDEIDYHERLKWLKQITVDMENVTVIAVQDQDKSKESYDWRVGAHDIKKIIGDPIDIVFAGDDYKGKNIFEQLYEDSDIHYFNRSKIDISSTQIRSNPYKYFDYLPDVVKTLYLKKIVIIGTESCGKSTLIRNLAKIYNTTYVEELGRKICEEVGGIDNMQPKDFMRILIEHKALELKQEKYANKILFVDTEAIITLYYLHLLYPEIDLTNIDKLGESISSLNDYDLYLFLEPDVKWVQDGTRTYGDNLIRQENNRLLKTMLERQKIAYQTIKGDYHERLTGAEEIINKLIKTR